MTAFADIRSDLHDDFGAIEHPAPEAIRAAQRHAVTHESRSLTRDLTTGDVGEIVSPTGASPAALVVARWHDEAHIGAYRTCQEQPCAAVRLADD